jgi:hypothetical protein
MPISIIGWVAYVGILLVQITTLAFVTNRFGFRKPTVIHFGLLTASSVLQLNVLGLIVDQYSYHKIELEFSISNDFIILLQNAGLGKFLIPLLAGLSYIIFSPIPLLFIQLNVLFCMFIPLLVGQITRKCSTEELSIKSSMLTAFTPWIIFWAPRFGRESAAFLIIILQILLLLITIEKGLNLRLLMSLSILMLVTSFVRSQLNVGIMFALLIYALCNVNNFLKTKNKTQLSIYLGFFFSLFSFSIWVLFQSGQMRFLDKMNLLAIKESNAGISGREPQALGKPTSNGFESTLNVIFGPFPTDWRSPISMLIGIDGFIFGFALICLAICYRNIKEIRALSKISLLLLIPLIAGTSLQFSNFGLNFRIRAHMYLIILPALTLLTLFLFERLRRLWSRKFTTEPL